MVNVILLVLLYFLLVGVELLPPNEEFCLGSIVNWTCTVNGSGIGWVYNASASNFYLANDTNMVPLIPSPFRTGPTIISGGVSTSMATGNLSSNAFNGTRLNCEDGGINSASVVFNLTGNTSRFYYACLECCNQIVQLESIFNFLYKFTKTIISFLRLEQPLIIKVILQLLYICTGLSYR